MLRPTLQDYSLVDSYVKNKIKDYKLSSVTDGFYYFALDSLFQLQDDEILDSITDTHFIKSRSVDGGNDRGIDVVYIDDSDVKAHVHIFNFKYAQTFESAKKNFPSREIEKILGYLNMLMTGDKGELSYMNPSLASKTEEVWELFSSQNPNFTVHLCSNMFFGLETNEKKRFELGLARFAGISLKEHHITDWANQITKRGRKRVNAKIHAIDKNYFEKSHGDIRALILNCDAKDLIRIIIDNEEFRNQADFDDYTELIKCNLLEDAFEDNVRVYLKQRTKINRNIKETALSDESFRFFYYNNGITITCDKFKYNLRRAPIIELENLQVVNGSQTLHALFDAFKEKPDALDDIDLLVRIYETENDELTTRIAEYTNSQNPVCSRDIRAIDYNQIKLERELLAMGYYYEPKRNKYSSKPKNSRIDSEKAGQVLMAFYNKMPGEAKNRKSLIFSDKYDEVFNDDITAEKLLLPYLLYEHIEFEKKRWKDGEYLEPGSSTKKEYLPYATYYILYILGQIAEVLDLPKKSGSVEAVWGYYNLSLELIEDFLEKEKSLQREDIQVVNLFRSGKPKKYIEDRVENGELLEKCQSFSENSEAAATNEI